MTITPLKRAIKNINEKTGLIRSAMDHNPAGPFTFDMIYALNANEVKALMIAVADIAKIIRLREKWGIERPVYKGAMPVVQVLVENPVIDDEKMVPAFVDEPDVPKKLYDDTAVKSIDELIDRFGNQIKTFKERYNDITVPCSDNKEEIIDTAYAEIGDIADIQQQLMGPFFNEMTPEQKRMKIDIEEMEDYVESISKVNQATEAMIFDRDEGKSWGLSIPKSSSDEVKAMKDELILLMKLPVDDRKKAVDKYIEIFETEWTQQANAPKRSPAKLTKARKALKRVRLMMSAVGMSDKVHILDVVLRT